jgi:small GTP-binding protein
MDDNQKVLKTTNKKSYKIVIIGDTFVGKTSILNMLLQKSFNETKPTIGAQHQKFIQKNKNGEEIELELWDTAGQERFRSLVPMYYRGSKGIIVVYDITNQESFMGAKKWIEEIKSNNTTALIALVGNKIDLIDKRVIPYETGKSFATQNNYIFYECSAKENKNVNEIFEDLADKIPKNTVENNNSKLVVNEIQSKSSNGYCCQ